MQFLAKRMQEWISCPCLDLGGGHMVIIPDWEEEGGKKRKAKLTTPLLPHLLRIPKF